LRVFENKVPRGIYGPKSEEVVEVWRKFHNDELHKLCIIRAITSRRMRWAGHVARMTCELHIKFW